MSTSILLLEDEKNLALTLKEYLCDIGHQCEWVNTISSAKKKLSNQYDIYLLDINLPDGDGISFAREIKNSHPNALFFFISAINDPEVKLTGLELGAYDYITKPFTLKEVILRIDRALANTSTRNDTQLTEEIIFKPSEYLVEKQGQKITLSQKECEILKLLLKKKGQAVSRDLILNEVWGTQSYPSNRTIDNYIVQLRKIFESSNIKISSIRGVGYKLEE